MKWQFKYEPSDEAREFRWIRSYDKKFLVFSAIGVVVLNLGLTLYEQVWKDQPQGARITAQDREGAVPIGLPINLTDPVIPSTNNPVEVSK